MAVGKRCGDRTVDVGVLLRPGAGRRLDGKESLAFDVGLYSERALQLFDKSLADRRLARAGQAVRDHKQRRFAMGELLGDAQEPVADRRSAGPVRRALRRRLSGRGMPAICARTSRAVDQV